MDNNNHDQRVQELKDKLSSSSGVEYSSGASMNFGKKSKKINRTMILVIVSVLSILVIAIGTAFLLSLKQNSDSNKQVASTTNLSALGESMKSSISNPEDISMVTAESSSSPAVTYKISNKLWVMFDDGSSILTLNSNRENVEDNEADFNNIVSKLKSAGLNEVGVQSNIASTYSSTTTTRQYFSSDYIVCNLSNTPELNKDNTPKLLRLQVNCANTSAFAKNAESIKPFAEIYTGDKKDDKDMLFGKPDIQKSATDGYSNSRLSVSVLGDSKLSVAKFYQTTDGNWHFFTIAENQDKVNCSDYNSDDLVNAFVGFTCQDKTVKGNSFVQKKNPVFEVVPGSRGG